MERKKYGWKKAPGAGGRVGANDFRPSDETTAAWLPEPAELIR